MFKKLKKLLKNLLQPEAETKYNSAHQGKSGKSRKKNPAAKNKKNETTDIRNSWSPCHNINIHICKNVQGYHES